MYQVIDQAQPPLQFLPQIYNPLVAKTVRFLLPAWLKFQCGINQIETENLIELVKLYQQFAAGKVRFILAFRHPCTDDPFTMAYLLGHLVPRAAHQQGIKLRSPVHSYFLYDRGVPLWAGGLAHWLLPRMGGSSIFRGKLDTLGLKAARQLLMDGQFPLAIAPEGATNDHNELISPLEPGVAQLGFWCAEDLLQAGRPEEVVIVPVCIQYRYEQSPWLQLEQLLNQMEREIGLPPMPWQDRSAMAFYDRLLHLGEHCLTLMEAHYSRFYHQRFPALEPTESAQHNLMVRLQRLLNTALQVAESYFKLEPRGTFVDRCRRLEQVGWEWMFRTDLASLSPLERGLADWMAQEASLRLMHMRLAERLTSITGDYIRSNPSPDRFAEVTLILWKILASITNGNPNESPKLGQRRVKLTIGMPLSVSDRWGEYSKDRRSARQAVSNLTADLQASLEGMITLSTPANDPLNQPQKHSL
mgnify:CR=1 FL=1